MAERGLFAFDCNPHGGPYRMVAAPVVPCQVADLPRLTRNAVERIALRRLRFREQPVVTADALRESE
jgi:hypothetical protein